jgi:hypothetical protein
MHLKQFAIPIVALFLGASTLLVARAHGMPQGPPPPGYEQDRGGWDVPPQELDEIQRQGFHDGVEAARKDFETQRRADADDHELFRHPHLPPERQEAYRDGFRRGYDRAMSHLAGAPGPQMREPERRAWDMPPDEFNDVQRQGFHDGMEGARRDSDNHRRFDVNNRDEYRHPHVSPELRDAYREGFRHGYDRAMAHLTGQPVHD